MSSGISMSSVPGISSDSLAISLIYRSSMDSLSMESESVGPVPVKLTRVEEGACLTR